MNKQLQKAINIVFFTYTGTKLFLWYENSCLQICKYVYNLEKKYKSLKGLRIIHISDLHDKKFGWNQSIIINKIKKLKPDIIVTTGDMSNCVRTSNCINLFKRLKTITENVYYIQGNHEERTLQLGLDLISKLRTMGINCLINNTDIINFNNQAIEIIGLKSFDLSFLEMIEAQEDNFRILLTHEPQWIPEYSDYFNLALCGHTHGAQWRFPIINKGLLAPDQGFFPQYDAGEYSFKNSKMIINRGLGNETIFPRLNNRPEIGVIDFI